MKLGGVEGVRASLSEETADSRQNGDGDGDGRASRRQGHSTSLTCMRLVDGAENGHNESMATGYSAPAGRVMCSLDARDAYILPQPHHSTTRL